MPAGRIHQGVTNRNIIVITGGLGMLGTRVLEALLRKASSSETRAILVDTVAATRNTTTELQFAHVTDDSSLFTRGKYLIPVIRGDVGSPEVADALKRFVAEDWAGPQTSNNAAVGGALPVGRLLSSSPRLKVSVFHLASVMSAQAERNFAQAFRINVDGTRLLLEACRDMGCRPTFVFASTIAAFGKEAERTDDSKLLPQTTYGMTKACAEMLVNDCTRKGFIDGRIARIPTVVVRPGSPNSAATGCFSAVPKAVLQGQHFVSPVSADLRHPCISLSFAVRGLIRLHDVPESLFGSDRAVTLPSVSLTLRELEESAAKLARELGRQPGTVTYERDVMTEAVVGAMPSAIQSSSRARDLGLLCNTGADEIVREYVEDGGLGSIH